MGPRIQPFVGAAVCAMAFLAAPPLSSQTAHVAAKTQKTWTPSRTPDGHPDMQGYWTNATFTPLERPKELGTKEFYTEAEAADVEKQRIQQEHSQSAEDVHYDNVIWQGESYEKTISNRRTSMIFDPPDGRIPPLSEEGKKQAVGIAAAARRREAAAQAQDRTLAERCIAWGNEGPPMVGSTYNANLQIIQPANAFVIHHEIIHGVRTIPTDGTPHAPAPIHQLGGDSRGHWEGDTLVVDTTNYKPRSFMGVSSEKLHVTERFSRTGPESLKYEITIDDPGTWTKPWSLMIPLQRSSDPVYEYACHEGNEGLAGILAGARAEEAAAAKAK